MNLDVQMSLHFGKFLAIISLKKLSALSSSLLFLDFHMHHLFISLYERAWQ